jgi:hypothetical protein
LGEASVVCVLGCVHEALRDPKDFVRDFPIPSPTAAQRASAEAHVRRLITIRNSQHDTVRTLLDCLAVEHAIDQPTQRLQGFIDLDRTDSWPT